MAASPTRSPGRRHAPFLSSGDALPEQEPAAADDYTAIVQGILGGSIKTPNALQRAKVEFCKETDRDDMPTNSEILQFVREVARPQKADLRRLTEFLKIKPTRSLSGVVVAAVMTSPHPCPHGKCHYCPGGVENNSPQSYTGQEPAARRGTMGEFDPFRQTAARLAQLRAIGHPTDKVDLIIMGGTFPAREPDYQRWFVRRCLDAMNGEPQSDTLESAKLRNAGALSRCIGLTVESRPDWCKQAHVDLMLECGATRVELGVQALDDAVMKSVGRGHTLADVADATRIARDAGLKVCYHVMPGLPGREPQDDIRDFKLMFSDERFMPDMLKIYPTLVIKGTRLYDDWKAGKYEPYSTEQAAQVLAQAKALVPKWARIQRIQRDIPAYLIEAGVKRSDLRNVVRARMRAQGARCACIRCRESGFAGGGEYAPGKSGDATLGSVSYRAGGGTEHFISYDDVKNDVLIAYARLRLPSPAAHRPEIAGGRTAVVRELKVSGLVAELEEDTAGGANWQHRGLGSRLLEECERITRDSGCGSIVVNSGVGVVGYYEKRGYARAGPYVKKALPA